MLGFNIVFIVCESLGLLIALLSGNVQAHNRDEGASGLCNGLEQS